MSPAAAQSRGRPVNDALVTVPSSATLTLMTSFKPSVLTKRFFLDEKGNLEKEVIAYMLEGEAQRVSVATLEQFARLLSSLKTNQALVYGVARAARTRIVTEDKWKALGQPADPQPRTQEAFDWPRGPGILFLDHDTPGGDKAWTRDQLVDALRTTMPGLQDARMLWWTSSSSHICDGDRDLTGLRGQRLYLLVRNAADIPRAGKALTEHLWAAGYGRIEIGKAGQLLERTPVDSSVWQTNRLDFAAGALCTRPLRQIRGEPIVIPGAVEFVDTAIAFPEPTQEVLERAQANREAAREQARLEAAAVRDHYIENSARDLAGRDADDAALDQARATIRRALDKRHLTADFMVDVIVDGKPTRRSVGEILSNPAHYDGRVTLDPLEPEYDGKRPVGKLYLSGTRQNLYSFAHGGRNFRLLRELQDIELVTGRQHDAVNQSLDVLRDSPDFFDFGGSLVQVEDAGIHPLDDKSLNYYLGGVVQYTQRGKNGLGFVNPPGEVCKQILAIGERRKLKRLTAVTTAPTLRRDGSVLATPGFDVETGLLLEIREARAIPENPTLDQCRAALAQLMLPFKDFPFVGPIDRGVFLAALLTAPLRVNLPTAPAFGMDASAQGSGKTLLAICLASIATSEDPTIWPFVKGRDDEENRKRIFTALRTGDRTIIWDNVVGVFDSAALAATLTSENYRDRVLGKSESHTFPNRALFILTGNNLNIKGDMLRRVLTCRIEPATEAPFAREFRIDPAEYCKRHRDQLVAAALTLVRGYRSHAARPAAALQRAPGRMASFELWDDFVRQTVVWVGSRVDPGQYEDPMAHILEAQAEDPALDALRAFLHAWRKQFGSQFVSSQEVFGATEVRFDASDSLGPEKPDDDVTSRSNREEFAHAFTELAGQPATSAKHVGSVLRNRHGRVVDGMRLKKRLDPKTNSMTWRVECLPSAASPGLPDVSDVISAPCSTRRVRFSSVERTGNKPGTSGKPGRARTREDDFSDIA